MTQNLKQRFPYEDEIDFRELFKLILESKKLLISTILFFTIVSVIYSLSVKPEFKSSAILEIGYFEMPDGTQKSIEQASDLISNLNILQFVNVENNDQDTSFKTIENKIILIETTSRSVEQNENLLNEMISYIDERHSNLSLLSNNQKKDVISNKIEMIDSEISYIKSKELNERQLKRSKIEDRIDELKNASPLIDLEISQLEKIIIDETNNLSLLREANRLVERASNSPTLEQIIFNYNSKINDLNSKKYNNYLEIRHLNRQLKLLENGTLPSDQLFSLEQEKTILENELRMLLTQTQVNTRTIGNTKIVTIKPKTTLMASLGIIFGFITGVFLIFIRNALRSYKESQA